MNKARNNKSLPHWLNPEPWLELSSSADDTCVRHAIHSEQAGIKELSFLLSKTAENHLEEMAQRAQKLTRRYFGRTISLYAPLYLSDYCSGGCAYCGFASDRDLKRKKLGEKEMSAELESIRKMGIDEILLLTGERTPEADFNYLLNSVKKASGIFNNVTIEAFTMSAEEYKKLVDAGCTGVTLYQETYDPELYDQMHRWGPKKNFINRMNAPSSALEAGTRNAGLGALLGLGNPVKDAICLFQHAEYLKKTYWKSGVTISFPRLRPEVGGFQAPYPVSDRLLARIIFAFRICMPEVPLVLSTRESPVMRDGMAGLGISKMSVASRTTVGGYRAPVKTDEGQFSVSDTRDVEEFCKALRKKDLEPVFKNWDMTFRP